MARNRNLRAVSHLPRINQNIFSNTIYPSTLVQYALQSVEDVCCRLGPLLYAAKSALQSEGNQGSLILGWTDPLTQPVAAFLVFSDTDNTVWRHPMTASAV